MGLSQRNTQSGDAQFTRQTHKMGTHNLPDEHTKWGHTIIQTNTQDGDAQFCQTNTQWGRTIGKTNTQYFLTFGALYIDIPNSNI